MGLCVSTAKSLAGTPVVVPVTAAGEPHQVRNVPGTAPQRQPSAVPRSPHSGQVAPQPTSDIQRARRKSVSSEAGKVQTYQPSNKPQVEPKEADVKERLQVIISAIVLLKDLDGAQKDAIVDAMSERPVKEGDVIIKQGDDGDNFYVIERGTFTASKDGSVKCVYEGSGSFGELALLYDCPRAATITAKTDGLLWALDRPTFRMLVVASTIERRKRHDQFLKSVALFKDLSQEQLAAIADCLETECFEEGDYILKQGQQLDAISKFYILEEGTVDCFRQQTTTTTTTFQPTKKLTKTLQPGDVFGEYALLTDQPRQADCVASTHVKCLTMARNAFERLMGPVESVLSRQVDEYRTQNRGQASGTTAGTDNRTSTRLRGASMIVKKKPSRA